MELFLPYGYGRHHPFSHCLVSFMFSSFLTGYACTAAFNIPYEITAIHVLITYWTDKVHVAVVVFVCLIIFAYGPTRDSLLPQSDVEYEKC